MNSSLTEVHLESNNIQTLPLEDWLALSPHYCERIMNRSLQIYIADNIDMKSPPLQVCWNPEKLGTYLKDLQQGITTIQDVHITTIGNGGTGKTSLIGYVLRDAPFYHSGILWIFII